MSRCQYIEGYKDFPICNHILEVGPENVGYQTGMFDDGLPFEAEEYEYGDDNCRMREFAIIMPDLCVEDDDCDEPEHATGCDRMENKIEEFHYSIKLKECSVLPIGMVFNGQEDNFSIIKWYQEFIEEAGVVEYVSDVRSCSVFYYTDMNGNDLVQVRVGLITNGQLEAVSNIKMRDFPMRKEPRARLLVIK